MEIKWLNHNGRKILYVDYRGAKNEDDMLEVLKKDIDIEKKTREKIYILANFQNTFASPKYLDEVKRAGKDDRKDRVLKTALLGITGVKKILLSSYMLFTGENKLKAFDNEEEALNWLAS